MNTKMKRRMAVVTGVIVIVLIVVLAVVGGSTSATSISVADAASGDYAGQRVKVSGKVVADSFYTEGNELVFSIYDSDDNTGKQLNVHYDGGVAATFGNGVTAICTGKMDDAGVLRASEVLTKCPSKYENATDALDVAQLLEYGADIQGKPVKITGTVAAGTLVAAGQGDRLVLVSADASVEVPVEYDGALPENVTDGSSLVVTGSLQENGKFAATDVALEG